MENLNPAEILIYIINFAITFALLYLLLYKPVSKFLCERKERVAASLRDAEATQEAAAGILQAAQAELHGTTEKARKLSHEAIENAGIDAERILDNAQEAASTMLESARVQVAEERQVALESAFTEMISLAGDMASRILTREVTLEDNREIAEKFFAEAAKPEGETL